MISAQAIRTWTRLGLVLTVWVVSWGIDAQAADLLVGAATISITPDQPVALAGQMHTRIARQVDAPVTASALAVETWEGDKSLEQAIMVSCDLVAIRAGILDMVRARVKSKLESFDVQKLFLSATHTHTAPVMEPGGYDLPKEGIMQPAQYAEFLADRVAEAAVKAWESRKLSRVGWGLAHAVVAQNRRSVYADGRAVMYGATNAPDFRMIEGYEDHGVEVLFFWNSEQQLIATAINLACPAQEVEGESAVNADFWHPVRESLRAKHGKDLVVLAWNGASGDQSPHLMYRKLAEERMRKLRGINRLQELARRIVAAWEEAYEGARQEKHSHVEFVHQVQTIDLPMRKVSPSEYAYAKSQVELLANDPRQRWRMLWEESVVKRFEQQQSGSAEPYRMELHAIRLGDIAIATNDFELFTDFAIQMKARSKALQTFVIQLAGPGTYVPSERAVRGGGYSAIVESSHVGPDGGQVLADRTVELINSLWPADKAGP